jgi:hypothetical protein
MRALLRDQEDQTLIALEVTEAAYYPDDQDLGLYSGDTTYMVHKIVKANADSLIRELYDTGKADFTNYPAEHED